MNRRGFFGALIAPVGAIVAAKCHLALPESDKERLKKWFKSTPHLKADPAPQIWSTRFHEDMRALHQHELNKYVRAKVDEAAFKMMKGDLDGKV